MEATMTMGFWSPRRFGQLLLRELISGYRGLLIAMAAVGGTLIFVTALSAIGVAVSAGGARAGSVEFYYSFFANLLFLGGFIVTSLSFRELGSGGGGIFYLTVPGSIFEKFVSKLLVTSVGYAVGSTIFYTAAAAVAEGLTILIAGSGRGFFNPFDPVILHQLVIYMIVQSVFLLGSVWFRKTAFLKTILWVAIFGIAAAIIGAIVARIALGDHFSWHPTTGATSGTTGSWGFDLGNDQLKQAFGPYTRGAAGLAVFKTLVQVGWWITAPVLWLAAYFRLGEVEV